MASSTTKKKPYAKMIIMGIASIAIYAILLTQQTVVNDYFSRGGVVYAFLPIAAAFLVSIVHGSFTGNFWTVLGVEASKKRKEVK